MRSRIVVVVIRGSHVHHVPHTGFPQRDPSAMASAVNSTPTSAEAAARRSQRVPQRVRTAEALRGGRTPLALVAVAEHGAAVAEEGTRQAMRAEPPSPSPSACKEGCDWCCHLTVGAGIPEIARIVEHLRQTLGPDELDALHQRLIQKDAERQQWKAAHPGGGDP